MRRVLLGCALILSIAIAPLAPAGARPQARDRAPAGPMLADRDGDRVDDVLEARLRRSEPGARQAVVVATDGSVSVSSAHHAIGAFPVSVRLAIIDGFAARLTAGQVRALARISGVLRIDHDAVVRATMDAARRDYGADVARSTYGSTGAGVDICILDTGLDASHEQFTGKSITWRDFVGTSATPLDDHGHGTHVASIAAGVGTLGAGSAIATRFGGVAPAAGLWVGKVLDAQGSGTESQIIAGIDWCAGASGPTPVDVISMSLGTQAPSNGTDNLSLAANRAVTSFGKVVTAAAGNSGDAPNSIGSPGAAADVITVGAASSWSSPVTEPNHSDGIFLAYFSSRGGSETQQKPDIVAPGVRVTAAKANTPDYATYSGTSMATPFAAGAAALGLQTHSGWGPVALQSAMETTAEDYGPAGKDPDWGAGLLDVAALVSNGAASTTFPTHVHVSDTVPNGGEWSRTFQVATDDLDVPIAATVIIGGQCQFSFPGWGCLDSEWSPDLDAALFDPNGTQIALSQCVAGTECSLGRQETLHAMPTVAGTYRIRVYAYLGSPNDGLGGAFGLDLSTGPVGSVAPPPPPSPPPTPTPIHVSSLAGSSTRISSTTWRAKATIGVGDDATPAAQPVAGVVVTGHFDTGGSLTCTTATSGSCSVERNFKKNKSSTVFTVTGLSKTGCVYDPDSNTATSLTVSRP